MHLCFAFSLISLVMLAASVFAQMIAMEPYGFLKGDAYYANNRVRSWSSPIPTAVTRAVGEGASTTAFSAAHSRVGLKGSAEVGEVRTGGLLELDFFSTLTNTDANANPRMRLAYAWVKPLEGLEIRTGQQWDIFSPLNPVTNNTNANLWFAGNYGFRRPMFQVQYSHAFGALVPSVQLAAGEGAREAEAILGGDNTTLVPLIEMRISANVAKTAVIGVSGVYGRFDRDGKNTTAGFNADFSADMHRLFAVRGEFCYGSDLNQANIFTIGGAAAGNPAVENIGFWFNVISEPFTFLHIWTGCGLETITSEVNSTGLEKNFAAFGDIVFPIGAYFSFIAEYQYIRTTPVTGDPASASIVDVAGKLSF